MSAPAEIRQAVAALIEGTRLCLDDSDPGAVAVANPAQPDRGTVLISTDAACVSQVRHEYFGHLEGFTPRHGQCQRRTVPGALIIHLLTAIPVDGPPREGGRE
jgi:hypothetical protein